MKQLTLAFLISDNKICLAYKKRGFGEGLWNGYGGKLEPGETLEKATCREIKEESGVEVEESALEKVANHHFIYIEDGLLDVHVFLVRDWRGEPVETEEMRPVWYHFDSIPYQKMWEDDQHWLPRVIAGEKLKGKVWFDDSGFKIKEMDFKTIEDL